ncbi:MAG: ABC transporter ATP-binding protein [Oscillospiraceae bacterium]
MDKLKVENLCKVFSGKTVLDNISFDVKDGEFLSILGASGCGKTTILRILIGLLQSDSGSILKDDIDITNASPSARGMGIVFQNYALFQNMTVLKNVEYALQFNPERKANAKAIALALLEQVGLTEYKDKKPYKLSGGQQQRVAIARTLAMNPDIILFDEPMSALDVANRLVLRDELKNLQKKYGSTMIYITHDQEEAFALSDRIMVMKDGEILQLDTPENIINNPANDYVNEFVIHNLRLKMDSLRKYV